METYVLPAEGCSLRLPPISDGDSVIGRSRFCGFLECATRRIGSLPEELLLKGLRLTGGRTLRGRKTKTMRAIGEAQTPEGGHRTGSRRLGKGVVGRCLLVNSQEPRRNTRASRDSRRTRLPAVAPKVFRSSPLAHAWPRRKSPAFRNMLSHMYVCVNIYIYICIYRERERERHKITYHWYIYIYIYIYNPPGGVGVLPRASRFCFRLWRPARRPHPSSSRLHLGGLPIGLLVKFVKHDTIYIYIYLSLYIYI